MFFKWGDLALFGLSLLTDAFSKLLVTGNFIYETDGVFWIFNLGKFTSCFCAII